MQIFLKKFIKSAPMESTMSYKQLIAETSIAETTSPNRPIPPKLQ